MRESRQISLSVNSSLWCWLHKQITVVKNIRVVEYEEDSEAVAKKLYAFLAAAAHMPPDVTIRHTDAPIFLKRLIMEVLACAGAKLFKSEQQPMNQLPVANLYVCIFNFLRF